MHKHILLCTFCGWKRICGLEDPGLNEMKNDTLSSRKFRCPGCGRGVAPRKFKDPQKDLDDKLADEKAKAENEEFMKDSISYQESFLEEIEDG